MTGLVKYGRFEFVNGGYVAHDEACPTYNDIIENMRVGHQWLQDTFGLVPKIGWHVDAFGHSAVNAKLFAEMGFDALFFGRDDFEDKAVRKQNQSMEFLWQPQFEGPDGATKSEALFTHLLYNGYAPPYGIGF
jgi:hypothetical protein